MSKKLLSIFLLSSLLFVACNGLDSLEGESSELEETPELLDQSEFSGMLNSSDELFHDFGNLDIMGGLVNHTYTFENSGDEVLELFALQTSCMCTQSQLVLEDGTTSDSFGMDSGDGLGLSIAPGETFEVLVTYDPLAHGPDATGEINRSVLLMTSSNENARMVVYDPMSNFSFTQMNIKGMVLSSEDFINLDSNDTN